MFCRYCGKALPGSMICTECGRENTPLEGGSGFWDLLQEPAAPAPDTSDRHPEWTTEVSSGQIPVIRPIQPSNAELVRFERRLKERNSQIIYLKGNNRQLRKGILAALVICILLLGAAMILNGRIQSLKRTVTEMSVTLETVQEERDKIAAERDEANGVLLQQGEAQKEAQGEVPGEVPGEGPEEGQPEPDREDDNEIRETELDAG